MLQPSSLKPHLKFKVLSENVQPPKSGSALEGSVARTVTLQNASVSNIPSFPAKRLFIQSAPQANLSKLSISKCVRPTKPGDALEDSVVRIPLTPLNTSNKLSCSAKPLFIQGSIHAKPSLNHNWSQPMIQLISNKTIDNGVVNSVVRPPSAALGADNNTSTTKSSVVFIQRPDFRHVTSSKPLNSCVLTSPSPTAQTGNLCLPLRNSSSREQHLCVLEEELSESQIGQHHNDSVLVVKKYHDNTQQDKDLLQARKRALEASRPVINNKARKVDHTFPNELDQHESDEEEVIASESDSSNLDSDDDFDPYVSEDCELSHHFENSGSNSDSSLSDEDFVRKKKAHPTLGKGRLKNDTEVKSKQNLQNKIQLNQELMKILPKHYSYANVTASAVIGTDMDKFNNIRGTIRVDVKSKEEAEKWLNAYEISSKTNFRVMKTWKFASTNRVVFKKLYRCHHNTLAEKSKSKIPHEKHVKCPAQLTITVKHQGMQWSKDELLKSHPCEIDIKHIHNHHTERASGDILRHRRPSPEVTEVFTKMFTESKSRITPAQAMDLYLSNLEEEDPGRSSIGDGALCPEMAWVYKLYNKIMKNKCGEPYGPDMISALEENINEYNLECKDISSKLGSTEDGNNHYVAICSPMMKRVLTHHKASGEIMFMDSSGNMDSCNARVFVILTSSVLGGLPLGLLITFSEAEDIVTLALQLWKELLPKKAFFGRGLLGPKIIITDDSYPERSSLKSHFPQAVLLLCLFHVLQAMWRYIWDSKHMVPFEDKPYTYYLFRQLIYASSIEEFSALYDEVLKDPKLISYNLVWKHIADLRHRAAEWALCYRVDLILRGINTNNLDEIAMRIIKDKLLRRLKAYNTVQLFCILTTDFDNFYKRKLALVIHNRMRNTRSKLRVDPKKLKPLRAEKLSFSNHLFRVRNVEKNTEYIVDSEMEICSCKVGMGGAPCKHQLAVVKAFNISHQQFLPTNDPSSKMIFYYIMTGKTHAEDGLFSTLKGGDVVVDPVTVDIDHESMISQVPENLSDNSDLLLQDQLVDNVTQLSSELLKEKLFDMAEDLYQKITGSLDYLSEPMDKFLKAYWAISKGKNSDSTLASALSTFGKNQNVLQPAIVSRKTIISVQPGSLGRRVVPVKGKQAQSGGRPRKTVDHNSADHAYNAQVVQKRKPTDDLLGSWACPPKKSKKLPHSLQHCVTTNVRLPK